MVRTSCSTKQVARSVGCTDGDRPRCLFGEALPCSGGAVVVIQIAKGGKAMMRAPVDVEIVKGQS